MHPKWPRYSWKTAKNCRMEWWEDCIILIYFNPRTYTQIHTPTWYKWRGEVMEPLPRVFDLLQYFGTILPSMESLWCSQLDEVQCKLSLRTPLYYGQFVWFQKCQKSYIPYHYDTDSSIKQPIGSVPLVSVLKRFDCVFYGWWRSWRPVTSPIMIAILAAILYFTKN